MNTMRRLPAILILCVAGCIGGATAPIGDAQSATYTLASVDQESLPAAAEGGSAQRWVLSGSLALQPDGYYLLLESDSIWTGRAFSRVDRKEGGIWTADGSVLTLTDTATEAIDSYGGGSVVYFGTIAPNAVVLTIPNDLGDGSDIYRFER
jgi:hypothetical protein